MPTRQFSHVRGNLQLWGPSTLTGAMAFRGRNSIIRDLSRHSVPMHYDRVRTKHRSKPEEPRRLSRASVGGDRGHHQQKADPFSDRTTVPGLPDRSPCPAGNKKTRVHNASRALQFFLTAFSSCLALVVSVTGNAALNEVVSAKRVVAWEGSTHTPDQSDLLN